MCVPCFSVGAVDEEPHLPEHPYRVIENVTEDIYAPDWDATDELRLLEALCEYGPNHWKAVSNCLGRGPRKCETHYESVFLTSSASNLSPDPSSTITEPQNYELMQSHPSLESHPISLDPTPNNPSLAAPTTPLRNFNPDSGVVPDAIAASEDQIRKNITPDPPSPTQPHCLPLRGNLEVDWDEKAEDLIADLSMDPTDSPEVVERKMKILVAYNERLERRNAVKDFLFDRQLLEYSEKHLGDIEALDEQQLANRLEQFSSQPGQADYKAFYDSVMADFRISKDVYRLILAKKEGGRAKREMKKYEQEQKRRISRLTGSAKRKTKKRRRSNANRKSVGKGSPRRKRAKTDTWVAAENAGNAQNADAGDEEAVAIVENARLPDSCLPNDTLLDPIMQPNAASHCITPATEPLKSSGKCHITDIPEQKLNAGYDCDTHPHNEARPAHRPIDEALHLQSRDRLYCSSEKSPTDVDPTRAARPCPNPELLNEQEPEHRKPLILTLRNVDVRNPVCAQHSKEQFATDPEVPDSPPNGIVTTTELVGPSGVDNVAAEEVKEVNRGVSIPVTLPLSERRVPPPSMITNTRPSSHGHFSRIAEEKRNRATFASSDADRHQFIQAHQDNYDETSSLRSAPSMGRVPETKKSASHDLTLAEAEKMIEAVSQERPQRLTRSTARRRKRLEEAALSILKSSRNKARYKRHHEPSDSSTRNKLSVTHRIRKRTRGRLQFTSEEEDSSAPDTKWDDQPLNKQDTAGMKQASQVDGDMVNSSSCPAPLLEKKSGEGLGAAVTADENGHVMKDNDVLTGTHQIEIKPKPETTGSASGSALSLSREADVFSVMDGGVHSKDVGSQRDSPNRITMGENSRDVSTVHARNHESYNAREKYGPNKLYATQISNSNEENTIIFDTSCVDGNKCLYPKENQCEDGNKDVDTATTPSLEATNIGQNEPSEGPCDDPAGESDVVLDHGCASPCPSPELTQSIKPGRFRRSRHTCGRGYDDSLSDSNVAGPVYNRVLINNYVCASGQNGAHPCLQGDSQCIVISGPSHSKQGLNAQVIIGPKQVVEEVTLDEGKCSPAKGSEYSSDSCSSFDSCLVIPKKHKTSLRKVPITCGKGGNVSMHALEGDNETEQPFTLSDNPACQIEFDSEITSPVDAVGTESIDNIKRSFKGNRIITRSQVISSKTDVVIPSRRSSRILKRQMQDDDIEQFGNKRSKYEEEDDGGTESDSADEKKCAEYNMKSSTRSSSRALRLESLEMGGNNSSRNDNVIKQIGKLPRGESADDEKAEGSERLGLCRKSPRNFGRTNQGGVTFLGRTRSERYGLRRSRRR